MTDIEFALWTDDPKLAGVAAAAGVQNIGPDLEVTGKLERQAGTSSLLSGHALESLPMLRPVLPAGTLFVRTDPPSDQLLTQIDSMIAQGVTCFMFPMIRNLEQAQQLTAYVGNRAKVVLMIEHADVLDQVEQLAQLPDLHALYIGVNDLALSVGYASRFGPIADGLLDDLASRLHRSGIRFGFLGAADFSSTAENLPVPPDLALAEMVRLGARWIMFARSFNAAPETFAVRLSALRQRIQFWREVAPAALAMAHREFIAACSQAESKARLARTSGLQR